LAFENATAEIYHKSNFIVLLVQQNIDNKGNLCKIK